MTEIKSSMICYLSNATENGKEEVIKGVVLNRHPFNTKVWLVKSGETLLWMLESYIITRDESVVV